MRLLWQSLRGTRNRFVNPVRQDKLVRSRKRKGACHVDCPFDIVAERACLGVIQGAKPREAKMRQTRLKNLKRGSRK